MELIEHWAMMAFQLVDNVKGNYVCFVAAQRNKNAFCICWCAWASNTTVESISEANILLKYMNEVIKKVQGNLRIILSLAVFTIIHGPHKPRF